MARPKIGRESVERMEQQKHVGEEITLSAEDFSPEDAAEMLIRFLPEPHQEKIHEVAVLHGKPVWQVVLGYVHKISEWGQLFSPAYLSQWDDNQPVATDRVCQTCRAVFVSPTPDGLYCCQNCYFGKLEQQKGHAADCGIPKDAVISG